MKDYRYIVVVTAETADQADTVMAERLGPDEDYGFEYTVGWDFLNADAGL